MVNCEPRYRNLNRIQSFSEQMYPTVELFTQICRNDEYLKQKLEEVDYLTPPAVRKRFNPIRPNLISLILIKTNIPMCINCVTLSITPISY